MVYSNGVVKIIAHLILPEAVFVLMEVEDEIPQSTIEHLPTTLVKWC